MSKIAYRFFSAGIALRYFKKYEEVMEEYIQTSSANSNSLLAYFAKETTYACVSKMDLINQDFAKGEDLYSIIKDEESMAEIQCSETFNNYES
jgi:hypothetical protein